MSNEQLLQSLLNDPEVLKLLNDLKDNGNLDKLINEANGYKVDVEDKHCSHPCPPPPPHPCPPPKPCPPPHPCHKQCDYEWVIIILIIFFFCGGWGFLGLCC